MRGVFDHVTIRVSDREAVESFYGTVLATLGVEQTHIGDWFTEWDDFSLAAASEGNPVTRRLHIGFAAPSRDDVLKSRARTAGCVSPGALKPAPSEF